MNRWCCAGTTGGIFAGLLVRPAWLILLGLAASLPGGAAGAAEPVTAGTTELLSELSPAELQIRYAENRLRLAELTLKRAQRANQLSPDAVGPQEVARLTRHVELTRRQVEIARNRPRTTVKQTNLAAAEVAVANAKSELVAARKANMRTASDAKVAAVTAINIARLEAALAMAEVRLELLRRPSYVPSLIDEMQWHIDQLTNEVIDLRHRLETGAAGTFGRDRP